MKKAFSLIELSIVLIIIGLLAAGISGGSSLISHAKMNSLIKDINSSKFNLYSFKLTYDQIPGDFNKASAFFNVSSGNGDGSVNTDDELKYAAQHLAKADIISNEGYDASSNYAIKINSHSNAGYIYKNLKYSGESSIQIGYYNNAPESAHIILFANKDSNNSSNYNKAFLKPKELYQIDRKLDDGKPDAGTISYTSYNGSTNTRSNSSVNKCADSSKYYISKKDVACNLVIFHPAD
jgi:prepilin-type N-terminal cleavage/methylation domain-containing protein